MANFVRMNKKIVLLIFLGLVFGWYFGLTFILTYLFFVGVFYLGSLFGNWYSSNRKINNLMSFIAWSNMLAGVLSPPLGVFVASATFSFSKKVEKKEKRKFIALWIIGVVITVINALVGAYIFNNRYN